MSAVSGVGSDPTEPTATLEIGRSSSRCSNCRRGASISGTHHDTIVEYGPDTGKPACGARWTDKVYAYTTAEPTIAAPVPSPTPPTTRPEQPWEHAVDVVEAFLDRQAEADTSRARDVLRSFDGGNFQLCVSDLRILVAALRGSAAAFAVRDAVNAAEVRGRLVAMNAQQVGGGIEYAIDLLRRLKAVGVSPETPKGPQ